jgi:hypothetical protein
MNASLALIGAAIAALMYIPLTVQVWRKTLVQNFATYFLWGVLDAVAAGSIWYKGGNSLLPAVYVLCCLGVVVGILRTKTFAWSWRETLTSLFVVVSVAAWFMVDSTMATIVSTTGVVAAGLPQLYDIWKNPKGAPVLAYTGFTLANALSTMAGHDWSVQERLYGGACTVLTIVFVIVGARKWLPAYRLLPA